MERRLYHLAFRGNSFTFNFLNQQNVHIHRNPPLSSTSNPKPNVFLSACSSDYSFRQLPTLSQLRFMTTGRRGTHYYDLLGLTSKATQKQIKTAYYAMSKKYHPDVAENKKSHAMFTEINEAYEVLGNIQKRRMYDRGMFNPRDQSQRVYDDGDYTQSYKSKTRQSPFERGDRPPPPTGRSKVYNFDEFYKQHYNEMRERRSQEFKEFQRYKQRISDYDENRGQTVSDSPLALPLILTLLFVMVMIYERYDRDTIIKNSNDNNKR